MSAWRLSDIPELCARTVAVTGGNIELGFRSALELARRGAVVFIGCRGLDKGNAAAERIPAEVPAARIRRRRARPDRPCEYRALRRGDVTVPSAVE